MPHSITAVDTVLAKSQAHGAARFLLTVIATHMNAGGLAWPSVKTLAEETHFGERYVHRLLKILRASTELDIQEGKGPFNANLYRLGGLLATPHLADLEEGVVYGSEGVVYGSEDGPQGVVPEPPKGTSKIKVQEGKDDLLTQGKGEETRPQDTDPLYLATVKALVSTFVETHALEPPGRRGRVVHANAEGEIEDEARVAAGRQRQAELRQQAAWLKGDG